MKKVIVILFPFIIYGLDLKLLQKELEKRGNPWVAGSTSVSHLPWKIKQIIWGGMKVEYFTNNKGTKVHKRSKSFLPQSFDWRNFNGHNWNTPVKDQGMCGSCWAFATIGMLEARIKILCNEPDSNPNLSEQFLVSCDPYDNGCGGGLPINASRFLVETGGCIDEACFPYQASDVACENKCSDWQERLTPVIDYGTVEDNIDAMKEEIMNFGPIAVGIVAYKVLEDIFYYKGGVYTPIMGRPLQANHAVVLVGWNDEQNCFFYKNSWGAGWGDNGYGTLGYSDVIESPSWIMPGNALIKEITVWNLPSATANLEVSNMYFTSYPEIMVASPLEPFTLAPGGTRQIKLAVRGAEITNNIYDTLFIISNDPYNPQFPVPVSVISPYGIEESEIIIGKEISFDLFPTIVNNDFTIKYFLAKNTNVSIIIYNIVGRKIKEIKKHSTEGEHTLNIDIKSLPNGIYFCSFKSGDKKIIRKFVVLH